MIFNTEVKSLHEEVNSLGDLSSINPEILDGYIDKIHLLLENSKNRQFLNLKNMRSFEIE